MCRIDRAGRLQVMSDGRSWKGICAKTSLQPREVNTHQLLRWRPSPGSSSGLSQHSLRLIRPGSKSEATRVSKPRCSSSRVRRLLWNVLGRRILPECKSEVPSGCPAPRRAAAFRRESKNAANSLACLKPFFRSCYEHVLSVATARQWTGQPLLEEVVSIRVAFGRPGHLDSRPKPTVAACCNVNWLS